MSLKVVMYVGRFPRIFYIDPETKRFTFRGRGYRTDNEATCQVLNKGDIIKGTVELLYIEGYPIPIRSKLNVEDVYTETLIEIRSEIINNPKKSFLDIILRRN